MVAVESDWMDGGVESRSCKPTSTQTRTAVGRGSEVGISNWLSSIRHVDSLR